MHPILRSKDRILLYLACWVPVAFLLYFLLTLAGRLGRAEAGLLAAPMAAVYSFICLAAWYPCRAFPLGETRWLGLLGVHGAGAALSSALWIMIGAAGATLAWRSPDGNSVQLLSAAQTQLLFWTGSVLYLMAVFAHYMLDLFEVAREAEARAMTLAIQAREAELRALRAQVDPHFLFNSLHAIGSLTTADPAKSRLMCERLGDFLRRSLEMGRRETVALDEELFLAAAYLDVEKVRLGTRLRVRLEAGEEARRCAVPPLILQPLVENAVRHGVSRLLEGGEVALCAERQGERLIVRVENPCDCEPPPRPPRPGIGLANVRERLRTLHGSDARLEAGSSDGRFTARIVMPAIGAAGLHGTEGSRQG